MINCPVSQDDTQPFVSEYFSVMQRVGQSPDLCEATATASLCERVFGACFRLDVRVLCAGRARRR